MLKTNQARVLRFTWKYVRRRLPVLLLMLVILLISTASFLTAPFMYKIAIDAIASGKPGDPLVRHEAVTHILYGIGFAAIALLLEQCASLLLAFVEAHVLPEIHADVFAKVQRLSTDFHVNSFAGATSRKIGRGVDSVEGILDKIWFNFLPTIALMIGFLGILTSYAPIIGVTMLIGMTISLCLAFFVNVIMERYQTWTDRQDTRVTASMVDAITGNSLIKSFAAEEREDARHSAVVAEWCRRLWKTWSVGTGSTALQYLFLLIIEAIVLLFAIGLWSKGQFTTGGFVVVILYIVQIWGRLWDMGRNIRDYMKACAHCEEMIAIADRPLAVIDRPGAKELTVAKGAITFEKVTFRYENQSKDVFKDFSLSIAPGEKVALVGHSGGGKSSFVKLLLRLYDVQEGKISIDGQNIADVTQQSLRLKIALVPQDPILFHRSIFENIAYGKPDASMQEVEDAARKAHADEFIATLPRGYETLVGERGVKLSGGERQRVAIARAILADRPILILDEATSSLDSLSEKYIQEALALLMEGRTTIVIAHRLSTIKRADRILVIDHGGIIEEGTHAKLLEHEEGLYRHLYDLQAGGFIGA